MTLRAVAIIKEISFILTVQIKKGRKGWGNKNVANTNNVRINPGILLNSKVN